MGHVAVLALGLLLLQSPTLDPAASIKSPSYQDLLTQGAALHIQGEYEKSYDIFRHALALCRGDEDQDRAGRCLIWMGILQWDLGDNVEAARHFEEASGLLGRSHDLRSREFCLACLEIIRLQGLGRADRQAKLYYQSLDRLTAAASLGRELGLPDFEIKCLRQLALTHLEMGDLAPFLEKSQRSLELASLVHHRVEQGRSLNNIGVYYQQRFDYSRAVSSFEQSLELARAAGDRDAETACFNNLGLVHQELGNIDRAYFYFTEALARDQGGAALDSVAMDLANIGSVLCRRALDQGSRPDLLEAREALQKSLSIQGQRPPNAAIAFTALNNLGVVLDELEDHSGARLRFEQALKLAEEKPDSLERAHALVNIAASYLNEGDLKEAQDYYQAAYRASAQTSLESVLMEAGFGLGQCFERTGDFESALSFYRRAITALEGVRARLSEPLMVGFARNKFRIYEHTADILAARAGKSAGIQPAEEMFDLFESARARAFLESLRAARADVSGSDLQRLADREKAIARNIAVLNGKLARREYSPDEAPALRVELEREEEAFVRLSADIRLAKRGPATPWGHDLRRIGEIQEILRGESAVLLEYFLGERRSYLLRIGAGEARLYDLPPRPKLERSLRAYLKSLSDRSLDPAIIAAAADRVSRELLPVDDEVFRTAKSVIVVPDGILYDLPFETLPLRDRPGPKCLVEQAAVTYVPSASALAILKDQVRPPVWAKEVLAVGPPARSVPPLPFGQKEVRDLATFFPAGTADLLLGESVDESSFKARPLADYRIIHFACHGDLNVAFPLRSSLALSAVPGSEEDGLLQMREVYGLKLSAELVVLSACQTGKGRLERSEGPLALARPFFFAGARAVIASLWSINDRSTAPFMSELYRQLKAGRTAAEALRQAKLKMLRSKWAHPFYWAGFLLQGDPSAAGATGPGRRAI